tara:strand:- start:25846 stop:26409 length:564 start_codon:yes stop_codon:yes gene_type:complete
MSKQIIEDSIFNHSESLNLINKELISSASEVIINAIKAGQNIFWCGNGGSASQANHLSAELVGGMYKKKIKPFKSLCLNVDSAFITAWSNDDSFKNIFSRQLEALSTSGDVLICLSTSGNSSNVIEAAKYSRKNRIKVISLTGNEGGELNQNSDICINIATNCTQRIQEMHILIGHILCDIVEQSVL